MNADKEICFSDDSGNLADDSGNVSEMLTDDSENDFDSEEMLQDKCVFRKASKNLGTVLRPGVVRPLSPTLKVYSLENEFPGVAMLYEGFDDMHDWKSTIEYVRFFAKKKNMFNRRHHWDMRTQFLKVRLRCMEKIVEAPRETHSKPVGGFFVHDPIVVNKVTEGQRTKTARASEEEQNVKNDDETDKYCPVNQLHYARKEHRDRNDRKNCIRKQSHEDDLASQEESHVKINNDSKHEMPKHTDNVNRNGAVFSFAAQKDFNTMSKTRMDTKQKVKNIDIWIPSHLNTIEDSYILESPDSCKNESVFQEQLHLQKKNIHENCTIDEKLERESLEKELNLETQLETKTKCGHFLPGNDSLQDLQVIGHSVHLNSSLTNKLVKNVNDHCLQEGETVNFKSETSSGEELVLEEINDKDFIPNVTLPSSCKLKHTSVKDLQAITEIFSTNVRRNLNKEIHAERQTLSPLQRLRKRIRNIFSCFVHNRVTPVDI